jgi:hypothetical protein
MLNVERPKQKTNKNRSNLLKICAYMVPGDVLKGELCVFNVFFLFIKWVHFFQIKEAFSQCQN